jgi:hypothetical protein
MTPVVELLIVIDFVDVLIAVIIDSGTTPLIFTSFPILDPVILDKDSEKEPVVTSEVIEEVLSSLILVTGLDSKVTP